MYVHAPIIAAFDPQSAARAPVEFGIAAARVTQATLVIAAVVKTRSAASRREAGTDGEGALERLRLDLERRDVAADIRVFEDGTPAQGLERAMHELEPELVVVGATRRSAAGSMLVGTTAERVLHASACPVAVVPQGYEPPAGGVRLIGVAFAPSPEGRDALHAAAALARSRHVGLRAITVLDPRHAGEQASGLLARQHHDADPAEDAHARERLGAEAIFRNAVGETASDLDVDLDVLAQDPADGLVAAAAHVDMLVMGSRAYGPKRAVLLGTVSRQVMERASCPVLIVPRGASEATATLLADAASRGSVRAGPHA
jgi:nucleotide-binding universal stress UspA family protein